MFSMRWLFVGVLMLSAPAAWAQVATRPETKIVPSDSAFRNEFGNSVALDGDWMVIGDQVDDYGAPPTGAAYVYRRRGADWAEVAKLTSGLADDAFGLSVDISGSTIVVGAWADHETGSFSKGAAYVYERGAHGAWHEVAKLWPDGVQRGDHFGRAVAVSRCRVLVGAPWTDGPRNSSGAAYVFDGCAGAGWRQTAKLTSGELADGFFGTAVALDGGSAVVGANANNEHGTFTGAAYVFGRHEGGLNQWGRRASLAAYDAERDKNFGWSVGVRGETVVVGARGDDHTGSQAGAAYVFPVPMSKPVCDVAARATAEGVRLDFRLGPTLPADWSV